MQTGGTNTECPFPTVDSFVQKNCTFDNHVYPNTIEQTWVVCAARHQTRFCDLMVQINTLRNDLDQLLNIGDDFLAFFVHRSNPFELLI